VNFYEKIIFLFGIVIVVSCGRQQRCDSSKNLDSLHVNCSMDTNLSDILNLTDESLFQEDDMPHDDGLDLIVEDSPEDENWLTHYKENALNFKCTAIEDINAIENLEVDSVSVCDFVSYDAKLHDLRGNVSDVVIYLSETDSKFNFDLDEFCKQINYSSIAHYCVFEDWLAIRSFSFDSNGKAIYVPLVDLYDKSQVKWKSKRNKEGQLVRFELENYMADETEIYFYYGENGMLDSMYYYGMSGEKTQYTYDESHDLISSYSHACGSSEVDVKDSNTYKIVKKDRYGNWIKRLVYTDRIDSEGEYSERRKLYKVEYRKIDL